jgi:CHAD domain-containing protein
MRELDRTLDGARRGEAKAVHRARVATRRLREALPILPVAARPKGKLERNVRRLTRALGPVRELDVALEMLDALDGSGDVPPAAIVCLRDVMRAERRTLHADAVKAVDRWGGTKIRKRILEGRNRTAKAHRRRHWQGPDDSRTASHRAVRRAEHLRTAIANAAGLYLPDRLHEVRIAAKKLRYALEASAQVGSARRAPASGPRTAGSTGSLLATLKRAQDLLGRMHDLEVLMARTRAVQGSANAPSLRLSGDLDRLVRRLEMECRQLHGQYMSLRPGLLSVCERVAAAPRPARRTPAA